MGKRAVLEVDLKLLRKNCETLQKLSGKNFFCPMIKANAYGHGVVPVAKTLWESGVKQVGVISASEAWPIREMEEKMDILIFGPLLSKEDLAWIVEENLVLVCSNWKDLENLAKLKKAGRIHIKLDTGFSRLGFDFKSLPKLSQFLKDHPQIRLEGLLTQLVSGEELGQEDSFSSQQISKFSELKKYFPPSLPYHVLNTSALVSSYVHGRKGDWGARPGIGLYGIKPEVILKNTEAENRWKEISFFPVSCLKSYVVAAHSLDKGEGVSYGGTWKASRPSQVAVVSFGYGDGFLRGFGKSREILFRGERVPLVGAVCMDFFMIDVTDCVKGKVLELGEEVLIFGNQGKSFLSIEEQASASGTISYELFSRLGERVDRVYKTS